MIGSAPTDWCVRIGGGVGSLSSPQTYVYSVSRISPAAEAEYPCLLGFNAAALVSGEIWSAFEKRRQLVQGLQPCKSLRVYSDLSGIENFARILALADFRLKKERVDFGNHNPPSQAAAHQMDPLLGLTGLGLERADESTAMWG